LEFYLRSEDIIPEETWQGQFSVLLEWMDRDWRDWSIIMTLCSGESPVI